MYNLAILYDESEIYKPSNPEFIEYFVNMAACRGIHCVLIKERHIDMLQQFDGLFIRVTTKRDHYTLAFAEEAVRLGLDIIDHPNDIWQCSSKLYQRRLFLKTRIEYPVSKVISKMDPYGLGYPCIVKTPDTCFGEGVYKIDSRNAYNKIIMPLFHKYPYLLMQEYLKTRFDWRIAVLAGKPLFAIKYYIIRGDHRIVTPDKECDHETIPLGNVPSNVMELALRACKVIGNGLYGVDIKHSDGHLYVIEVNDNPSIDRGTEDECEGDAIYHRILDYFCDRHVIHRSCV